MRKRGHPLFAAVYDDMSRPLELSVLSGRRERLLAGLRGEVLEVGAGTGVNLPYYREAERLVAVEPDPAMRRRLAGRLATAGRRVEVSGADAESLPYPDASFDAVVFTLVLCTVTDQRRALAEAARVLKPGGRLVVIEHVRGTGWLARFQDLVTPLWALAFASCHPNRDTAAGIEQAGFRLERLERFQPLPGWLPVSPMIEAVATRAPAA
jgi:ubiquinone/menaquinone biosynthesis C-methylase UbiE